MNVGDRFDFAMQNIYKHKRYGADLAREFGITTQAANQYKNKNKTTEKMREIATSKEISLSWLEFGEGEMYASSKASVVQNQSGRGNAQTHGSNNTVTVGESSRKQAVDQDLIEELQMLRDREQLVEVPYHKDIHASAGAGSYNQSPSTTPMAFSPSFLKSHFGIDRFNGLHIINATGDSMEPTIMSGELLFVNPFENEEHQIKDGSIYVIMTTDVVMVKRVRRNPITKEMKLVSDNKEVDDILLTGDMLDECKIVGRVIGHFDTL